MKKISNKFWLISVLVFSCLAVSLPTFSSAASKSTDTITVYGRNFTVTPYQENETHITWEDVKSFLPADIAQQENQPLSDDEILNRVEFMQDIKSREYDKNIAILTDNYMKTHPSADAANVSLNFGQTFLAKQGNQISPDIQKVVYELSALKYLDKMLRTSMNKGPRVFKIN